MESIIGPMFAISVKEANTILRVLKNRRNQKVLQVIIEYEYLNVTDIYIKLRSDQSNVSQALRELRSIKVVIAQREGKNIYYSPNLEVINKIQTFCNNVTSI